MRADDIRWFGRWLPPIMLALIAATQICLAFFMHLVPWKGGGFGMFATIDGKPPRTFTIDARDVEGRHLRLEIPPAAAARILGRDAATLTTGPLLPNELQLKRVLSRLRELRYIHVPYSADRIAALDPAVARRVTMNGEEEARIEHYVLSDGSRGTTGERLALGTLTLDIWRLRFDPASGRLGWETVGKPVTHEPGAEVPKTEGFW